MCGTFCKNGINWVIGYQSWYNKYFPCYLYLKPSGEIICNFRIRCHQYAYDTQLYITQSKSVASHQALSHCLTVMIKLIRMNKLKMHPGNTEVMLLGKLFHTYS